MYAAGGEPNTADDTLYAMVQCTRDLSPDDCNKCLEAAIKDVSSECYASGGARLLSSSCYLRYELYAFYEGPKESSVSTKKEGGGGRKIWMIVVLTI
ncbi:putative cysteine-rich repeat secretory protein 21, partial [Herrania umbratica]|uniref:Cysteine-rich repeat secretory protein 21 n=1 Tax=Herrania umbratica TaxID=108875 RepID=A0A6J1BQB4_9ROSI